MGPVHPRFQLTNAIQEKLNEAVAVLNKTLQVRILLAVTNLH